MKAKNPRMYVLLLGGICLSLVLPGIAAVDSQIIFFEGNLFVGGSGPGNYSTIQSAPVFGFGQTEIYAELSIEGELVETRRQDANVFLFFVIVKPGGG